MSEQTGRARGRSRGRARGAPPGETARRPGTTDPAQVAAIVPPPVARAPEIQRPGPQPQVGAPPPSQTVPPSGGRALHRGVSAGPRPGEPASQFQPPTAEMSAMALGDTAGRGARRGRRDEMQILATRPASCLNKVGTAGRQIKLFSNYFMLETMPNWAVQQYHVDFLPNIESSRMRRALLRDHKDRFGDCFTFDGMSDLKTPVVLSKDPKEVIELCSARRTDNAQITIRIRWAQELAPTNPELLHLFNTMMRRFLEYMEFVQINRRFFDKRAVSVVAQHNIEVWQGISTAIGQHDGGVMMVTDTIHKFLRRDNVLKVMQSLSQNPQTAQDECVRKIVGCIVMTPYNNRTYKVDDIDWSQNPRKTFDTKEGPKSYLDYYQTHYQINIKDPNQPLLVCRPKERDLRVGRTQNLYLIPELCVMTGLTDEMRSNFNVMRDLDRHTKLDPNRRTDNLKTFITRVHDNAQVKNDMAKWNLRFSTNLVQVEGRIQPDEKIVQGPAEYNYRADTADWQREMRDKKMHVAKSIQSWVVIVSARDKRNAQDFVQELLTISPPMGIQMGSPTFMDLQDDRAGSYTRSLNTVSTNTQLAMLVLPNNRKDRYDVIKKQACVDMGLATQVILGRTISNKKNLRSVATKVAVQLNCKLGGAAWCLQIPLKNSMVIGYDTYHDSSQRGRSAGGFVASMNREFTQWYSRVSFHNTHQELGNSIKVHFSLALKEYKNLNGEFPSRIFFFRDGVSDGQLLQVKEWEVAQIEEVLRQMCPGNTPALTFLVVTKRISTRFYMPQNGGYANPPPGTVVDTTVTRPERYDFYLVSQSVRQGTVTPTHFNIIYDNSGLKPEHLQRLSYKLTHLYYNWSGTIRVPAPCQYAHKLAFLAGQSLHAEPNARLLSTLFYL